MARMCGFCGKDLKHSGCFHTCDCGFIETDDMSYEEVCDHVAESNKLFAINGDVSEEIPF